jgi:hypothetical protein
MTKWGKNISMAMFLSHFVVLLKSDMAVKQVCTVAFHFLNKIFYWTIGQKCNPNKNETVKINYLSYTSQ